MSSKIQIQQNWFLTNLLTNTTAYAFIQPTIRNDLERESYLSLSALFLKTDELNSSLNFPGLHGNTSNYRYIDSPS